MNKLTTSSILFLMLTISISILAVGLPASAQDDPAQEPIPAPWPEEPGAMPELLGGKKAGRPIVFIEPDTSSNSRQSVDDITFNIWYGGTQNFGQIGNPQEWVNILGNVSSPFGVQSLTYTFKGVEKPVTIGPGKPRNPRLVNAGDFNIEIDYAALNAGANVITLKAVEGVTNIVKEQPVTINYMQNQVWPEAYTANWATAAKIEDVAQIVDGKWGINGAGKLYVQEVGYDRLVAIGEMEYPTGAPTVWTDYEVRVPIKVNGLDESGFEGVSNGPGIGLLMRWQGQTQRDPANPDQPALDWERTGGLGWYRWQEKDGAEGLELRGYDWTGGTSTAKEWEFGVEYIMKMSVQTDVKDPTRAYYRLKFWKAGTKEPVSWDLQGFSKPNNSPSGSVVLIAHHVDAEFGQVTVEPLADLMYTLNATKTGMGEITLTSHPSGQTVFRYGETVRILAIPATNYVLDSWSGDVSLPGTVNPLVLSMTSDVDVTANFVPVISRTLTVNIKGMGEVTKNPDKESYESGETVTLTAVPEKGWVFSGWSGDLSGAQNPTNVTMDGDKSITANFSKTYGLTITVEGQGQVLSDPDQLRFVEGDAVTLTAVPEKGWVFSGWSGDLSGAQNPATLTMNGDKSITANFSKTYGLIITVEGQGQVLRDPDQHRFVEGDAVTLTAVPESGWVFSGWSGDLTRDDNPVTLAMDGRKVVKANFVEAFLLNTTVKGSGRLRIDPEKDAYLAGDKVTLTAVPESGWVFSGWSGDLTGDNNPTILTMDAQKSVTAVFVETNTLTTTLRGNGQLIVDPKEDAYFAGDEVTLTALPEPGWVFSGWCGDLTGDENPITLIIDGNMVVVAQFERTFALTTAVLGSGQLIVDPYQETYIAGEPVALTAVPDRGWTFTGWIGDAAGHSNPLVVRVDRNKHIIASFSKIAIYMPAVLRP